MKLVSVIVPIYNVSEYLEQCIESILKQSYKNIEVILVDDGSKDNSGEICDKYKKEDDRIIVIHQENQGLVSARKSGLKAASGYYVTYVDGDDWIDENALEKLTDAAEKNNAKITQCSYYYAFKNRNVRYNSILMEGYYSGENFDKTILPDMLYNKKTYDFSVLPSLWAKLYVREYLYKWQNSVYNTISYGEDAAVTFSLLMSLHELCFIDIPLYYYRQNENSMTNSYNSKQCSNTGDLICYMNETAEFFGNNNYTSQVNYYAIRIMNANFANEAKMGIKCYREGLEKIKKFQEKTGIIKIIKSIDRRLLSKGSRIAVWMVLHKLNGILLLALMLKK